MSENAPASELERRKYVRLRRRADLGIVPQKYEGRTYYVVKDPVSLRYYRFKEQEHFLLTLMDGQHTLDQAQKLFEERFPPERLRLEDLEQFGQQLLQMGLVQNESPQAGKLLYENRTKRVRKEWMQTLTNILYIKLPVFDPEKLLGHMLPHLWWMFTRTFLFVSIAFMLSAAFLVLTHFETFYSRLPSYHEFFSFKSVVYLWVALGVVKVIHEFGHGLSCKAFGGEVHEMGFLLLCFSPAMYCNVSDAWRLPNKWHRIIISAAGIYVELMIAAAATFLWWNTASQPFVNNLSLSLMVVCSVSTVMFNGNPLMRYDGYYVLADWLEIPNLRDRANRYMQYLGMTYGLGIEQPPEPYMELWRRVLFVTFAVVSYVYRWVVTFFILKFLAGWLKPYKLDVLSELLAVGALASMIGWPLYRLIENVRKRGRLPDMKTFNVSISASLVAAILFVIFFIPMPVTRIREHGMVLVQTNEIAPVPIETAGILKVVHVKEGEHVRKGKLLAEFTNLELEKHRDSVISQMEIKETLRKDLEARMAREQEPERLPKLQEEHQRAEKEWKQALAAYKLAELEREKLLLRAPRDGVVIGLPPIDEIGKRWDKIPDSEAKNWSGQQSNIFCSIGNKNRLRVVVPLTALDYNLLQENLNKLKPARKTLPVTIRVQGHDSRTWSGHISQLPQSDAKEVPIQLTVKGGGPLAVKPSSPRGQLVPQNQVFLVDIDFDEADDTIAIYSMAQAKIHCEYRSCAWWIYRTACSMFDLGFYSFR
jgi:putative peptide zinc metalloprotease protein